MRIQVLPAFIATLIAIMPLHAELGARELLSEALKNGDPSSFEKVRSSLSDYLDDPDPRVREQALDVSGLAGLSGPDVRLIAGLFQGEADYRVRASMLRATSSFADKSPEVASMIVFAISSPYEQDDGVAIELASRYPIQGVENLLLKVMQDGSISMRLASLRALVRNYHISSAHTDLLLASEKAASDEVEKALLFSANLDDRQRAEMLQALPAKQLKDLIGEVRQSWVARDGADLKSDSRGIGVASENLRQRDPVVEGKQKAVESSKHIKSGSQVFPVVDDSRVFPVVLIVGCFVIFGATVIFIFRARK